MSSRFSPLPRLAALALVLYGVWASFDRDMRAKLFLGFAFDYWPAARPEVLFSFSNIAIIGLYAFCAHCILRLPPFRAGHNKRDGLPQEMR